MDTIRKAESETLHWTIIIEIFLFYQSESAPNVSLTDKRSANKVEMEIKKKKRKSIG